MLVLPQRTPFLYDELRFLTAFWSGESMHGELFETNQLPPEEHEERINAMVASATAAHVDPQVIEWAKGLLARNDKTLRARLEDLLERSGAVGRLITETQPKFLGNLTGTRGPLSHSGSGGKLRSPARYFHSEALRWVVRACALIELGVPAESAEQLIVQHEQFGSVLQHLADESAD
jgi:hypothetical protein